MSGSSDAQTSFLARMLGDRAVGMEDLTVRDGGFTNGVYSALVTLYRRLFSMQAWGGTLADDMLGSDAVASACLAYHLGDRDRAKRLMGLLDTQDRAERLFVELIRDRFAFPAFDWRD